jgi:hypothetical protein
MDKTIQYFNQQLRAVCDENCSKAWGWNTRPKSTDKIKVAILSDEQLAMNEAPQDPGTSEGGEKKPVLVAQAPTKWCIRECERCILVDPSNKWTIRELYEAKRSFLVYAHPKPSAT